MFKICNNVIVFKKQKILFTHNLNVTPGVVEQSPRLQYECQIIWKNLKGSIALRV